MKEVLQIAGDAVPCLALRKREMAAALSISEGKLEELTEMADGIPWFKEGNVIFYPVDEARNWLKEKCAARRREQEVKHGEHR